MRFVILLASSDADAKSNYLRLVEGRRSESSVDQKPQYVLLDYNASVKRLECSKPEIIKSLQGLTSSTIQIDFIAHGNPHNSRTLLVEPKTSSTNQEDPIVFSEITPDIVANFFKETANKETGKFNFESLTLFCCRSMIFGQSLSEKMPDVKITCFNEDIRIDHFCVAYNGQNQTIKAIPHIFLAGRLLENSNELARSINENKDEKKSEVKTSVNTTAPASDILSAPKPMAIRGDPFTRYRSQSLDSYLQTERKNNAQEPTPSTPNVAHSSTLRKIPTQPESAKENEQPPFSPRTKR